jgi:hypothetical protein
MLNQVVQQIEDLPHQKDNFGRLFDEALNLII